MLPFGLGIPDTSIGPGYMRLSEIFVKNESISTPTTSDNLSSITRSSRPLLKPAVRSVRRGFVARIGESYLFQNVGGVDMVGTVTYATVHESEKKATIAVTFTDGTSRILISR